MRQIATRELLDARCLVTKDQQHYEGRLPTVGLVQMRLLELATRPA
jgi:hypothetical protein